MSSSRYLSLYGWLFVFFLACLVLTSSGRICGGDAGTMYQVTRNMAAHGTIAVVGDDVIIPPQTYPGFLPTRPYTVETSITSSGAGGLTYSPYGWGQSLFALPLYALGQLFHVIWPGMGPQYWARLFVQFLNALFLAAASVLLVELIRSLGFGLKIGLATGLTFAFGTMVWPYVKGFYSEPATAFCLLLAAYALHRASYEATAKTAFTSRRDAETQRFNSEKRMTGNFRIFETQRPLRLGARNVFFLVAGLAFGLAVLFRVTALIAAPALGFYLLLTLRERRQADGYRNLKHVGAFICGCAPGFLIVLVYNVLRFGHPFAVSYGASRIGWGTPVVNGLYGLLFSPGKGLFLYNPVILLSLGGIFVLAKRHRNLAWMVAIISATYVLFHSPYSFWTGGWNWGPRFLLPVLPFMMLPVAALLYEAKGKAAILVFVLLAGLGFVIQLPAVLVNHSRDMVDLSEQYDRFYDKTVYELDLSPVMRQWPAAVDVLSRFSQPETWAEAWQILAASRAGWIRSENAGDMAMAELTIEGEFIRNNAPDFWWIYLYLAGASPLVAFGPAFIILCVGGLAAVKAVRAGVFQLMEESPPVSP